MDSSQSINSRNVIERLTAAFESLDWDQQTQNWKSNDGHWFSLPRAKLFILEQSLDLFVEACKIGIDIQYIIANFTLPILKNILSYPAADFANDKINQHVWQLIFNLVIGNTTNQSRIWNEFDELLLSYLESDFRHKDTCRLIVFNIYVVGKLAQNEGTRILKILLKGFHQEMYLNPSQRQVLNMFLEHFVIDETCISLMYLKLNFSEKLWILHFTIAHIKQGHFTVLPISMDFLYRICEEFLSKSEHIFNAPVTNDIDLQEIVVLFLAIAAASNERYYELNRIDVQIFPQIGQLLRNVLDNEEAFEKALMAVNTDSKESLKIMLLSTISNCARDSKRNKELARDHGIIECILDFMANEGTNLLIYRSCIFTLIDLCQSNAHNKECVITLATTKKNPHLRTLLMDINYKRKN